MRRDYHPMMIYFYFILYIFYIYFNFKKINSISYYFVFYSQTLFRLVKNERLERYEIFFGDSLCSRRIFFFFQNSTKFFHNNLKTKKKTFNRLHRFYGCTVPKELAELLILSYGIQRIRVIIFEKRFSELKIELFRY